MLVPRPISSKIISEFAVAFFKIWLTSFISSINVLCPEAISSDAPTRVKILSTIPMRALDAGTKLPTCAISVISATCRIYVDLPAIFGPVIINILSLSVFSVVSFGTNIEPLSIFSTTGCLPSFISILPLSEISGITKLFFAAACARDSRTSDFAIIPAARFKRSISFATAVRISSNTCASSTSTLSLAPRIVLSISLSLGVIYLSQFASVCFLI